MRSNRPAREAHTKPALLAFPGRFPQPCRMSPLPPPAPLAPLHSTHELRTRSMTQTDFALLERRRGGEAPIHGPEAFEGMRRAGRLTAEALDLLVEHVAGRHHRVPRPAGRSSSPWTTAPIRRRCIYRGYRKSICTSINHVVCHGIPNDKPLREGDIVNIDVTLVARRLARRFEPDVSPSARCRAGAERLIEVTYEALMRGIAGDPARRRRRATSAHAIQTYAEARALLGGARLLRPRARARSSTTRRTSCITASRRRRAAQARHVLHRRADDQPRPART